MKTQVNFSMFVEAFKSMDRFDQFGYEALKELFDHIEDIEKDTGEEFELDVIALCCDWGVLTREEILEQYSDDLDIDDSVEDGCDNLSDYRLASKVSQELDTYCYDLPNGSFLVCTAMI